MQKRLRSNSKDKKQGHNTIKNIYDIMQFKKMSGKGLIKIWNKITISTMDESVELYKNKIMQNGPHTIIIIYAVSINGIINIIKGIEYFLAINKVSYDFIKKNNNLHNIEIKLIQYPLMNNKQIQDLIVSLS